jgi:hypothetical protein
MKLTRSQALAELGIEEVRFSGYGFRAHLLFTRNGMVSTLLANVFV